MIHDPIKVRIHRMIQMLFELNKAIGEGVTRWCFFCFTQPSLITTLTVITSHHVIILLWQFESVTHSPHYHIVSRSKQLFCFEMTNDNPRTEVDDPDHTASSTVDGNTQPNSETSMTNTRDTCPSRKFYFAFCQLTSSYAISEQHLTFDL